MHILLTAEKNPTMSSSCKTSVLFPALLLTLLSLAAWSNAQLRPGYYAGSCSMAEFIVKDEVRKAFVIDRGVAAGLVRLHFHDCFVRGCDGSLLIDSTPSNTAEKDSPANNPSLRGFEIIDRAKARLESACKGVVSCADIVAFAARDSVELAGGIGYEVPAGRRDGKISLIADTSSLPPATLTVAQLTQAFANKGFTQEDMVTLSGAHTIGRSHCTSITSRLYNFSTSAAQDPNLDPSYARQLKGQCPQGSTDTSLVVAMNPATPNRIDASYYADILANKGLFTSDQTLLTNPATANQVRQNTLFPWLWKNKFAAAMVKMGSLDVLTGAAGEIRANCRVPNG